MSSRAGVTPGRKGAAVEVRALSKSYDAVAALRAVNLTVGPGEFVALLGPSGCGKTTLLRCIAGLIVPTAGDVLVDGRDITDLPVHRRGLGMVFQSYALFPHMTVAENVGFGLRMRGVSRPEREARIREALALVQMDALVDRYPGQMSGGQQQRVALARSLVTNPSVLLLDEPFGALDAQLRDSMQIELRRMQRKLGITAVFVTHDQREAFTMADRVAVLSAGQLHQFEAPSTIYNRPATPFVAQFIGQVNRLSGTVLEGGPRLVVSVPGRVEPLSSVGQPRMFERGSAVRVMIRPERIEINGRDGAAAVNRQPGVVSDVVFSGEKVSIWVDTAMGTLEVHQLSAATNTGTLLSVGESVRLGWAAESTMVFPEEAAA